jgi:uncharacterized Zn finger protein
MAILPRCPKCHGLQISERLREETQVILQLHCLNCGRIDEPGLVPNSKIYNGYATYGKAQWRTTESEA